MRLSALVERQPNTLVIGIDLGDKTSSYCVRTRDRQVVTEGVVATKAEAILESFREMPRQLMVMEKGTHSRWVAQLLDLMGHEVIVANARKLKLISENNQKSDRFSRLASGSDRSFRDTSTTTRYLVTDAAWESFANRLRLAAGASAS